MWQHIASKTICLWPFDDRECASCDNREAYRDRTPDTRGIGIDNNLQGPRPQNAMSVV